MECLGVEPGAAWWKAQTNPLSYGGTPLFTQILLYANFWTIWLDAQNFQPIRMLQKALFKIHAKNQYLVQALTVGIISA